MSEKANANNLQSNVPVYLSRNYSPLLNLFPNDFIDLESKTDYIPFGEDNLIPQLIVELARSVTIHRSIINSKSDYFSGSGFSSSDSKLSEFLISRNINGNNFHQTISNIIFDDILFGNAYFEIITDKYFNFLQFIHVDASTCRLSISPNEIILHPNWREYEGKNDEFRSTLPLFPHFELKDDGLFHSIYHIKTYEPEFSNYGLPSWYSGLASVIIAGLTDQWNQDRLESQFNGDGMLIIPGVNNDEDAQVLQDKLDEFTGSTNNPSKNNLLVQFLADLGPGQSREQAAFIPFTTKEDGSWLQLHTQSYNNLLSIHNWFKTLCSFYGDKTGFDTHRILNEYEIALNTVIKNAQNKYLDHFKTVLNIFDFNTDDLDFENQPPVYRINPVSYVWEVRRDAGLDFNPSDPNQQMFYSQLRNTFSSDSSKDNTDTEPGKNDSTD